MRGNEILFAKVKEITTNYFFFIKQFYRYSEGERHLVIGSVFLSVVASLTEMVSFGLLIPIMESSQSLEGFSNVPVLKWFSGLFGGLSQNEKLFWAAGCLLVLTLIRGAFLYVSEIASYCIPWRVDARLRIKVFNALNATTISFIESLSVGEQADATASNPVRIGVVLRFVAILLANLSILFINVAIMMIVSPMLTLSIVIVFIFLTVIYKKFTSNTVEKAGNELTAATTRFSQAFYDTLNGLRIIRLSGSSDIANQLVHEAIKGMKDANLKTLAIQAVVGPYFVTAIGVLFSAVLLGAALLGHGNNAALLASMVATIYLMSRLLGPVTLVNISRTYISANLVAFSEMDKFLKTVEKNIEIDGTVELSNFAKNVQFSNVDFFYPGRQEAALKDFNLTIKCGERIGIVGLSGSGKSTIINLITRLYRPTCGAVIIDGNNIDEIKIATWWGRIAVAMQDSFFSNISIRENLVRGLPQRPSDQAIWEALYVAVADEIVAKLPDRLETKLSDRNIGMSGGERQRLSLARALLRTPIFLILDEVTSQLDLKTEETLMNRLKERTAGTTVLIIAHRIGAVKMCDRIIVLKEGKVFQTLERSSAFPSGFPPLLELLENAKSS